MSGQADSPTLIGQKIVKVRPATDAELAQNGWERSCTVIVLDSGTTIFPSRDEEGNGPGALFGTAPDGTPIYVTARRR